MKPQPIFYKRYRMELGLDRPLTPSRLPVEFTWQPWHDNVLDLHANVLYHSFQDEADALVFPNFSHLGGCRETIRIIRHQTGFIPQATWLVVGPDGVVGTVQGISTGGRFGAIQNIGVLPAYRGQGLGEALLLKALLGFQAVGLKRVYLEVTALNDPAVRLYRKHGFRNSRTIYHSVERPAPSPVGMGL